MTSDSVQSPPSLGQRFLPIEIQHGEDHTTKGSEGKALLQLGLGSRQSYGRFKSGWRQTFPSLAFLQSFRALMPSRVLECTC